MTRQPRASASVSRSVTVLGRSCALLLGLLSLGGGLLPDARAQQAASAVPPALCEVLDMLLQVTVGGQTRGDFLVKVTPGGLLLEGEALQAAESGYGLGTLTCDGLNYVLLDPAVKPSYDPLAQTLSLTPVLALLPGNTLDFRGVQAVTPAPTQPAYGADAGLRASVTTGGGLSAQTYLGGAYFGGALSAYVGLSASLNSAPVAGGERTTTGGFGVKAIAHYDLNTDWGVSAAYRVDGESVGGLGYGVGSFTGLTVNTRGGLQRELTRVELELPLEANVVVRVGERTLRSFRAAPGKLVILNIPLENIVGTVEVNVTDSNGTRSFSSPYSFGGGSLRPGGYLATVRGGYLGDPFGGFAQRTLDASGRLGLVNNWSVQANARLLESSYGANVQARHTSDIDSLGFGVSASGSFAQAVQTGNAAGNTAGSNTPDVRVNADYARQIGTLGLSASLNVPLLNVGASQIGLGLGYQGGRWAGSLNGGYDLGGQQLNASLGAGYTFDDGRQLTGTLSGGYSFLQSAWTVGANAGYALSSTQQLNAFVNSSSGVGGAAGRVSAGVGLRYTPSDQLSVEAGASAATGIPVTSVLGATPTDPAATITRYGGTLAASYVIAPGQTVRASTDFASLSASYEDSRTLYTSANATLSRTGDGRTGSGLAGSLSGEVRGAVTFLPGRAVLGQKLGQRAVVVRTNTPGIPLLLNGARVAVTDASGEALLTGLPEGSVSQVAVDLDALPFNITARDATADIALAQSGVYILDWTRNFDVSRWVQLFYTPTEFSVYGVFLSGGQKYTLDDQGFVLIPDTRKAVRGTLQSDDGARQCELEIPATGDRATCPPQPLQNNVGQQSGAGQLSVTQPAVAQTPETQTPETHSSVAQSPATQPPVAQPPIPTDAQIVAQIAAGGPELLIKLPPINQLPADQTSPTD